MAAATANQKILVLVCGEGKKLEPCLTFKKKFPLEEYRFLIKTFLGIVIDNIYI